MDNVITIIDKYKQNMKDIDYLDIMKNLSIINDNLKNNSSLILLENNLAKCIIELKNLIKYLKDPCNYIDECIEKLEECTKIINQCQKIDCISQLKYYFVFLHLYLHFLKECMDYNNEYPYSDDFYTCYPLDYIYDSRKKLKELKNVIYNHYINIKHV